MLRDLLKPKDIDLLTVPIWIRLQKCLRFIWQDNLWEFSSLSFGLGSVPVFSPVVSKLKKMGIRLIICIDGILRNQGTSSKVFYPDCQPAIPPGVCHNQGQISIQSLPGTRISLFPGKFSSNRPLRKIP